MKIFLKIGGFLACILFLTQTANAQGSQYDGLYLGLDGSYDKHKAVSYRTENQPAGFVLPNTNTYSDDGPAAGIFIGYRQSVDRFTVAAEARYTYSFVKNEITAADTFNPTNEFGASVLPGYWVTDNVILFGRIGFSQLNTNRNYRNVLEDNTDTGLVYGGGIEIYLNDLFSIRADYSRTTHNHKMSQDANGLAVTLYNNIERERIRGSIVARF